MDAVHLSHWLQPAFNDPVLDAQVSFRAALKALSEPGLSQPLDRALVLEGLQPATYALCLAFLDSDTPLWLAPQFDTPAIRANLAFHCGCPIVVAREAALFALLDSRDLTDLSAFDNGSERYPDQSCTLLIQLDALDGGPTLRWRGPGIKDVRRVDLPVPADFWQQRSARNAFPRGLDAFFAAGSQAVGLPRSTRVLADAEHAGEPRAEEAA
ncbi:MAG: phosphonate C-P lyase system protein PhnH [Pseudomonadota bacterium]